MSDRTPETVMGSRTAFVGYPSKPHMVRDTMRRATAQFPRDTDTTPVTWEDLGEVGRGPVIINDILEAISAASVSIFEVTHLNQNVMFELGFAIGRDRHVWLLRDPSYAAAQRGWQEFQALTGIRYSEYRNSYDVIEAFSIERPWEKPETVFSTFIDASLGPRSVGSIFFLKSRHETDPDRELTRRVERHKRSGVAVVVVDPSEAAAQPLSWYAQRIYDAAAVLVHLSSSDRIGAEVHNARCALAAGMAHGMGVPVLMLAEADFLAPLDYQGLLQVYQSSDDAVDRAEAWLAGHLETVAEALKRRAGIRTRLRLATELSNLRLGEPVAEMEEDWLEDYFVPTAAFQEVLAPSTTLFVGRKGTGKTANLLRAAQELQRDKRNLVCVIKPASYELEGLVRLLSSYAEQDLKGYLVESLWKFLLSSEIALSAYREAQEWQVPPQEGSPQAELIRFMEANPSLLEEFAVRLEQVVGALLSANSPSGIGPARAAISERLHGGMLQELRGVLGRVLHDRKRVAVLIDNLDKAWERSADIGQLSYLLLGLLAAVGPISKDFAKQDRWRLPIRLSLAVFMRSDIYATVARVAREPDRIPMVRLSWTDPDLLLRIVEDRYRAARDDAVEGRELWEKFFVPMVDGTPVRTYVASRILQRPRDLVYFCNAAIAAAVNRGHSIIDHEDIKDAERTYSLFALDVIKVENGITAEKLEEVLYEFAGAPAVLTADDVLRRVGSVTGPGQPAVEVVNHLRALTFLGIETAPNRFSFVEDPLERLRDEALVRHFETTYGRPALLQVHPAYRSYLEVEEPMPTGASNA